MTRLARASSRFALVAGILPVHRLRRQGQDVRASSDPRRMVVQLFAIHDFWPLAASLIYLMFLLTMAVSNVRYPCLVTR